VQMTLDRLKASGANEAVLETEVHNELSLRLYENMGFIRTKKLLSYYMNASDAYRLKLVFNTVEENKK